MLYTALLRLKISSSPRASAPHQKPPPSPATVAPQPPPPPLPPAPPQRLAIATLRPEPGRGPRTIVVDVPSSIAPGGQAAGAASAGNARSVTVAIYDASGRHVRTLTRNPLAPGRHEFEWDGRGARGPVAAGVYWVRLAMGSEIVSARLTVLK